MVMPLRWKERNTRLTKLAFVLLVAFPTTLLVGFTAMYFEPPRVETRVFLSLDPSQRPGDLIDSGISTLDTVIAMAVLVTALGFVVGLVLLIISLYKRPTDAAPTI
jgi:hypothetical protein